MTGGDHLEIVLRNRPAEREGLVRALEDFGVAHGLPARVIQSADLALEEHLTNVFLHAFSGDVDREVRVRLRCGENGLEVEIADDGPAFDPSRQGLVDVSAPLEDRKVGGLGIHLMRQSMDAIEYRREDGKNILRLSKGFER